MAFAPTKAKKKRPEPGPIPLTSLMDAMTIILLFLLQQFNADGSLVTPAEGLKIPESVNTEKPKKATTIIATSEHILVENQVVAEGADLQFDATSEFQIAPLYEKLDAIATEMTALDENLFTGDLLIQADVGLDYKYFIRMVYTAGQAGFTKVKLVTTQMN